jgi:hypothetical protein
MYVKLPEQSSSPLTHPSYKRNLRPRDPTRQIRKEAQRNRRPPLALSLRRQEAILAPATREPVPPHLHERLRAHLHLLERIHRPRIRRLVPVRLSPSPFPLPNLPHPTLTQPLSCFVSYPIVFSELRGWSPGLTGLSYLGIGIGGVITILSEPLLRRMINAHPKDPATGKPYPEAMVSVVCIAAVCIPVGEMIFAWTCTPDVHWIAPLIAGIPFGAGNCGVFIYASNYLVHSYGIYAASALAGNAVLRSAMGGALPLAGPKMYVSCSPPFLLSNPSPFPSSWSSSDSPPGTRLSAHIGLRLCSL